MAIERSWERQGPVAFTANGGQDGLVTVSSVECFKVKQRVSIYSTTQPSIILEIKRVLSYTQLEVGPIRDTTHPAKPQHNIKSRADISAYTVADSAFIVAQEQSKTKIPDRDIIQAVYEHEPTTAIRTTLVDKIGNFYNKTNRIPVDISGGNFAVNISRPDTQAIAVKSISAPEVEESFTFPNGTKDYLIKARGSKDCFKIGLNAGDISNGNYWTVIRGNSFTPDELIDYPDNFTLYFQTVKKSNVELEIWYWYNV